MFSVFSNFLSPYIEEGLLPATEDKPSKVYNQLSIAYNQGSLGVRNTMRLFICNLNSSDVFDEDLLYEIWAHPELQKELIWFNEKIIPEFTSLSYQTIGVRIRILTGKLNKLVKEGIITAHLAAKVHENFTTNVNHDHSLIVNEDLPFQGCSIRLIRSFHVDMRC